MAAKCIQSVNTSFDIKEQSPYKIVHFSIGKELYDEQ